MRASLKPLASPGTRWHRRGLSLLAALSMLAVPASAHAEGPGFKLGESMVLHLGAGVGAGYDSNVFYASGDTSGCGSAATANRCDPRQGAFYLTFRPVVDIATLSRQRGGGEPHAIDFRFHAGMPLRFLTSGDPTINEHYSIGAEAGLLLSIFPFGKWTLDLFDNFVRISEPPFALVKAGFVNAQAANINSDQNQLGLRLRYRPGGGRFETTLQYMLGVYYLENSFITSKGSLINDFQLRLKWNFFPKTAVYVNLSETTNNYIWGDGAPNKPPNAYPLRVVAGLIGLVTPKLSVNLNIGYGNSFTQSNAAYPNSASYNNVIALAELDFRPFPLTILNVGYRHDFAQALIGTYYDLDGAYLAFTQGIWRITGNLRLGYERRAYQGQLAADGLGNNRVDNLIAFHVQFDLPIKDWLVVSLGDDLAKDFTQSCNFTVSVGPSCDYLRNDVWLRASFAY